MLRLIAPATLYLNGRIHTIDDGGEPAAALVVRDGRVVARGDAADVRRAVGAGAAEIDLRGATLMPGIVDTHPHVIHFGVIEGAAASTSRTRPRTPTSSRGSPRGPRTTPKGEWIMTTPVGEPHYFLRRSWRDLAEGGCPTATSSTAPRRDHPVWIQAWAPVIPNVCAFNSAGLAKLGLTRETPDQVEHVWIEKDAAGEPTGILRGSVTNYYTGDAFMNGLLRAAAADAARPLVSGHGAGAGDVRPHGRHDRATRATSWTRPLIEAYRILARKPICSRCASSPRPRPSTTRCRGTRRSRSTSSTPGSAERGDDGRPSPTTCFRVDGVTISRGGPCWPGFILMREPYTGPYGDETRGVSFVPRRWCEIAMRFCAPSTTCA